MTKIETKLNSDRETFINYARESYQEFKRSLNIQDGAEARNFLMYADSGFGELDPSGESSEGLVESEFNKLMKKAHLKAAREALDELFEHGDPKQVDAVYFHLRKADSTIETLAVERETTQNDLIATMTNAVVSARRSPHPLFVKKQLQTFENC